MQHVALSLAATARQALQVEVCRCDRERGGHVSTRFDVRNEVSRACKQLHDRGLDNCSRERLQLHFNIVQAGRECETAGFKLCVRHGRGSLSHGLRFGPPELKSSVDGDEFALKRRRLCGLCGIDANTKRVTAHIYGQVKCSTALLKQGPSRLCRLGSGC
jgi:hypothetical protein